MNNPVPVSSEEIKISFIEELNMIKQDLDALKKNYRELKKQNESLKKYIIEMAIKNLETFQKNIINKLEENIPRIEQNRDDILRLYERIDSVVWDNTELIATIEDLKSDISEANISEIISRINVIGREQKEITGKLDDLAESHVKLSTRFIELEQQINKKIEKSLSELPPFKILEFEMMEIKKRLSKIEFQIENLNELKIQNERLQEKIEALDIGEKLAKLNKERKRIESRIDTIIKEFRGRREEINF